MSTYLFDNTAPEAVDRFTSLELCFDEVSTTQLDALGVPEGGRCLEIGCGSGSVARWLAERVGPTGSVLATDINPERVRHHAGNLEVRQHDIVTDPLPESHFDVVHARLVLAHVQERRVAVTRILQALKPGGFLLVSDFDTTWKPVFAAPSKASGTLYRQVIDRLHRMLQDTGLELHWARNAHQVLEETGYEKLGVSGFCESWSGGSPGAQLQRANVMQAADAMVQKGLITESKLQKFSALLDNPDLVVGSYLMLSTWGYRPGP